MVQYSNTDRRGEKGMKRPYVGIRVSDGGYEVFKSRETPTEWDYGRIYGAVIGPFRTMRGARCMAKYGKGNPHIYDVASAERIATLIKE